MENNFDKERAHNMFYRMIQVDRTHRKLYEKVHDALGLHRSQHRLLMYISRNDTCPSQKDIAEHFGISPAAIAVSLKKLEDTGLISRESHENDNRFNKIFLTDKGKHLVEKSKKFVDEADFAMFKDFSDEDYLCLERCIEKLEEGLKDYTFEKQKYSSQN